MAFETDPEGPVVNDFSRWECVGGDGNIGCAGCGDLAGVAASSAVGGAKGLIWSVQRYTGQEHRVGGEDLKTWMCGMGL